METETFNSALLYLFAAYYDIVFNIAYPKFCYQAFIVLQKYVLAIGSEDRQTVPKSVREIVTVKAFQTFLLYLLSNF